MGEASLEPGPGCGREEQAGDRRSAEAAPHEGPRLEDLRVPVQRHTDPASIQGAGSPEAADGSGRGSESIRSCSVHHSARIGLGSHYFQSCFNTHNQLMYKSKFWLFYTIV